MASLSQTKLPFSSRSQPSSVIGITLLVCATSCLEMPAASVGIHSSGTGDETVGGQ